MLRSARLLMVKTRGRCSLGQLAWLAVVLAPVAAAACPFCTATQPTLSQRRDKSDVVILGEVLPSTGFLAVHVHQVLKAADPAAFPPRLETSEKATTKAGALVLLFGAPAAEGRIDYRSIQVNEAGYAYFAAAPEMRVPTEQRLAWFAGFLDHEDPLIAEDAFLEFAYAPLDKIRLVADRLPYGHFRRWIVEPGYPQERKGFLGLALALATDETEQAENTRVLKQLVEQPHDDFRAGFDGILGGYLLATGEAGLERLEKQYLANAASASGDVRHAASAMRFYHEHGKGISRQRLNEAMRLLLVRPEVAAAASTDLARWQDWKALAAVAQLYQPTTDWETRVAVIGYLRVCPEEAAARELERLRKFDPPGVQEVEQHLATFSSLR